MKTYQETLHWIHELLAFGMKPGLLRMEHMLEELGNPEETLKCVHIAGTNGKGSTLTFMQCALEEAGYNVGTFTSPYIEQFNERISVNGSPISDDDLIKVANEVRPITEKVAATDLGTPTEFEVVTVLSIVYFAKYVELDIVLFETGLGGRLDSTNVITPLLTGITNIGYDHTAILGSTIEQIAYEKSGIIKPAVPLVTGADQREALNVINERAKRLGAPVYIANREYLTLDHRVLVSGEKFSVKTPDRIYQDLVTGMQGNHQVKNASMAIMMLELLSEKYGYKIDSQHINNGFSKASWPGRFEKMNDYPLIYIDGAHNKEGIESLKETMVSHFPKHRKRIIFSALSDKPVDEMLSVLYDSIDHILFTSFDFPRASTAKELYDKCRFDRKDLEETYQLAITKEMGQMGENDLLIITGSLYFISAARNFLHEKKS
ncbi:folylpolyglutamate synthase/dihydrofolate synthase family protein [Alkalihalobacillus sp. AL-G]|uniref:bifunctional folylpolyglutamate synthase/dihydrofolate synthase n=1 Tax=Alkalihalobacillus sp. AL-G TaxID=2926399 RepID=UPI00272CFBF9|nr:folylpolyglutamate synthase/dihydrofolate synthase family protein [Alkalihalobacillus sp. AL-G]WLD92256.1 bifunctional folylpolyglutamate synthase/dihydrofolate synthase [Alkalihalobacillus sp. AL-G]